jgi:adenosylcobinamide-phosphate synthase
VKAPTILLIAVLIDVIFGEPPSYIHPVVWFGKIISVFDRLNTQNFFSFFSGIFSTVMVLLFSLLLSQIPYTLYSLHVKIYLKIISLLLFIYLLKSTFSIKSMIDHVNSAVESDFDASNVQMLVSRNAEELDYNLRCSAVIESLAENFVDSVVAPILYYSFFSLKGAMVYRATNTCDAMIGYRNKRYYWFGKFAARLDDFLNIIPARLSVIIMSIPAIRYGRFRATIKSIFEGIDGKINACSMFAMAYALNLRLEKPGYYIINPEGKVPEKGDVIRAIKMFKEVTAIAVIFFVFCSFLSSLL